MVKAAVMEPVSEEEVDELKAELEQIIEKKRNIIASELTLLTRILDLIRATRKLFKIDKAYSKQKLGCCRYLHPYLTDLKNTNKELIRALSLELDGKGVPAGSPNVGVIRTKWNFIVNDLKNVVENKTMGDRATVKLEGLFAKLENRMHELDQLYEKECNFRSAQQKIENQLPANLIEDDPLFKSNLLAEFLDKGKVFRPKN